MSKELVISANRHETKVALIEDDQLVGELVRRAAAIAKERGLSAGGYRTVFNTNRDAGQTVFHVHFHILGGRNLGWPPG